MLSPVRKRLIVAYVFIFCAVVTAAKFGAVGKADVNRHDYGNF